MAYSPPDAIEFYDAASNRQMMLGTWGDEKWVFYKHPDGQWVSLRKATDDDVTRVTAASVRRL